MLDGYRRMRHGQYVRLQSMAHGHETAYRWAAAVALAVITGAFAQISFVTPLTPVPYTLQVLGVGLMGGLLGSRWGAVSALLYLLMGVVGLPVFAGQWHVYQSFELFSGLAVFTGALTAGYLIGFPAMAYIVGLAADRHATPRRALGVFGGVGAAVLVVFAAIDAYFLASYDRLYPEAAAFPNVWFLVLAVGLAVTLGVGTWMFVGARRHRERLELFLAHMVGLMALYAVGALWFSFAWPALTQQPLSGADLLRYTVLPFIPAGITKALVSVAIISAARPTQADLSAPDRWGGQRHV